MGLQDYIRTMAPPPEWLEKLWAESRQKGLNKLRRRDIDSMIARARRKRTRSDKA